MSAGDRRHKWAVKRAHDRGGAGQLIVERCGQCGAGRTVIVHAGGESEELAVYPDPLPADCGGAPGLDLDALNVGEIE